MDKQEMTKRQLITCSVILMLVFISGLNIYSTKAVSNKNFTGENDVPTDVRSVALSSRISTIIYANSDAENDYSFASETLPVNNAGVNRRLKRSLQKHNYKTVQSNILQNKAERLFPIIEPILRAYGIPEDFKYIPLVESGLREGTSPKGARGPWQFMPGTARTYGLKVRRGVDERLNIRKSTIAACVYLKELYAQFNSWTLTAAAYNNGSVKLARAIHKQGEDDYFRMDLNRETGAYVYNLVAMKAVINQPKKYGFPYYKLKYFNPDPTELAAIN